LPYELRIGVTGHRSLKDPPGVRRAVDEVLAHLDETLKDASAFPVGPKSAPEWRTRNTRWWLARSLKAIWPSLPVSERRVPRERHTPVEWTVVSPLAAGADLIVAEAVLENERLAGPRRLEAMLPFERDEYEKDFVAGAELESFQRALEIASETSILRDEESTIADSVAARSLAYRRAGRATTDSCEILIAVWDGEEDVNGVGTAATVQYAVARGRFVLWIDARHPENPVRQLLPDDSNPRGWRAQSLPDTATQISPGFCLLAAYNRDPAYDPGQARDEVETERQRLLATASKSGLSADSLTPLFHPLLTHYARANQLAARYQALYTTTARWLFGLAAIAVTVPVLQVLFLPDQTWIIGFEVAALIVILLLLQIGRHDSLHMKWLHNRHLAEHLRAAIFMAVVGVDRSVRTEPLARFLPYYDAGGAWVNNVARRLVRDALGSFRAVADLAPLREFVLKAWIDEQSTHHEQAATRYARLSHHAHRLGLVLFILTLVAALMHAVGVGHVEGSHALSAWVVFGYVLVALSIALPAWGSAVHAVNGMLDRDRSSSRADGMSRILRFEVAREIEDARSLDELGAAVSRAAELMMRENYEWLTSRSFHELHRPG